MRKRYTIGFLGLLIAALFHSSSIHAQQLQAQNDLFSLLTGACNNYLDVTANDNLDSLPFQFLTVIDSAQHGLASGTGNYVSYCAFPGYTGADHFRYRIVAGGQVDTATVFINVLQHNSYIFPGDADQNGTVEHFDVLALGLTYKLTGPARLNTQSANALSWEPSNYISGNPGAADCNGDGIIDGGDFALMQSAYADTFPYPTHFNIDTSRCSAMGVPFSIVPLSTDTLHDGDTLDVLIKLGDDFTSNDAYGIAFTFEFDNGYIDGDAIQFFSDSSWLIQNDTAPLFFKRNKQSDSSVYIALTRTDHKAIQGGGRLFEARIPINDNIDGIIHPAGWNPLILNLRQPRLISAYDVLRDVCITQPSVMIYKMSTGIPDIQNDRLKIYPNPSNGSFVIEAANIHAIEVSDLTGRVCYTRETESVNKINVDANHLPLSAGAYFVKIRTVNEVLTQKIIYQP